MTSEVTEAMILAGRFAEGTWLAGARHSSDDRLISIFAATPALALCAASLRARAQSKGVCIPCKHKAL